VKQSFENLNLESGHNGRLSVCDRPPTLHRAAGRRDRLLEKLKEVHVCSRYDFPPELMKHFNVAKFIREMTRTKC
jgi:hypothetical protein